MARKRVVQEHPARLITIKKALVDVMMIPLVNWLNSFEDVTTLYCCQGDAKPRKCKADPEITMQSRPYVLFICDSPARLVQIMDACGRECTYEMSLHGGLLRYSIHFPTQAAVESVTARVMHRENGACAS